MQKVVTKFVTVILGLIILLLSFSGCSDNKASANSTSVSQQATQKLSEQTTEPTTNGSGDVEIDFSDLE